MNQIQAYCSPNNLYNKIINALNEIGKDFSRVTPDDLQPVDEFQGKKFEPDHSTH